MRRPMLGACIALPLLVHGSYLPVLQEYAHRNTPMSCDQICQNVGRVCDSSLHRHPLDTPGPAKLFEWQYFDYFDEDGNYNFCNRSTVGNYDYGMPYIQETPEPERVCYHASAYTTVRGPGCDFVPENPGNTRRICGCHDASPPPPPPFPPFSPNKAPLPPPPPPPPLPFPPWGGVEGTTAVREDNPHPDAAQYVVRAPDSTAYSCDATCHERGLVCDDPVQLSIRETSPNSRRQERAFSYAGVTCDSWNEVESGEHGVNSPLIGMPYAFLHPTFGETYCYGQRRMWHCSAVPVSTQHRRLCSCNPATPPFGPQPPTAPPLPPSTPLPPLPPPDAVVLDDDGPPWGVILLVVGLFSPFCIGLCCLLVYGDQISEFTGISDF